MTDRWPRVTATGMLAQMETTEGWVYSSESLKGARWPPPSLLECLLLAVPSAFSHSALWSSFWGFSWGLLLWAGLRRLRVQ